jgi:hypothetical protein
MKHFTSAAAILLALCTTSCASVDSAATRHGMSAGDWSNGRNQTFVAPPMDPNRRISQQDCRYAFIYDSGNLLCS